jgi:hypothetical protein
MSLLRNPRFILATIAAIFVGVAVWRLTHLEPKEPELSISSGAPLRIECAGVSIQPDPGWGVETFEPGPAAAGRPQLCSPGLKRLGASVTALLLPQESAASIRAQADVFTGRLHLQDVQEEEVTAASGLKLVHTTGISTRHADGGPAAPIRTDLFFFLNPHGRVAVVYEVALPDVAERFVGWFVQTVRMGP